MRFKKKVKACFRQNLRAAKTPYYLRQCIKNGIKYILNKVVRQNGAFISIKRVGSPPERKAILNSITFFKRSVKFKLGTLNLQFKW